MSSMQTNNEAEMDKLNWVYRVARDFGLPVVVLGLMVYWFAIRAEDKFDQINDDIRLHQKLLQQICVNTAGGEWSKERRCWFPESISGYSQP